MCGCVCVEKERAIYWKELVHVLKEGEKCQDLQDDSASQRKLMVAFRLGLQA